MYSAVGNIIKLLALWHNRSLIYIVFVVSGEPLVKEDEVFATECEALSSILEERARLYEEEEHALRVMIQEEVQERMLAGGEGGEGR